MRLAWRAAIAATAAVLAATASAHDLQCTKGVRICPIDPELGYMCSDFVAAIEVPYPSDLQFLYRVLNVHPTEESVVKAVADVGASGLDAPPVTSWFVSQGTTLTPVAGSVEGLALPVGAELLGFSATIRVESYEDCLAKLSPLQANPLACRADDVICPSCTSGYPDVGQLFDDRFIVTYDHGQAQCSARVICRPAASQLPAAGAQETP